MYLFILAFLCASIGSCCAQTESLSTKEESDARAHKEQMILANKAALENEEEQTSHFATLTGNVQPEPLTGKKKRETVELVEKAVKFLEKNDILTAAQAFSRSPAWRKGNLFIYFIAVDDQASLAYGDELNVIWKDPLSAIYHTKDIIENSIKELLTASKKDGWIYHKVYRGYKITYARSIIKDGKTYIVASGFYPTSVDFLTTNIVKKASEALQNSFHNPLKEISDPDGDYICGNLAVSVYTLEGLCVAHGLNNELIGKNRLHIKDSNGHFIIQDLIKKAKNGIAEGFLNATWNTVPIKIIYQIVKSPWGQGIMDDKKNTLIVMSYYNLQESGKRNLHELLSEAIKQFETYGAEDSFKDFSNPLGSFNRAGMHIEVYDLKGNCMANGENPDLIGVNMLEQSKTVLSDFFKKLIADGQKGNYVIASTIYKKATKLYYARLIKSPDQDFILTSSFYVHSKAVETNYLVKSAIELLSQTESISQALLSLSDTTGPFFKGDLFISVYRGDGTCLIKGNQTSEIWKKMIDVKDDKGHPFVKRIIEQANAGGGWINYNYNNGKKYVYSETVDVSLGNNQKKERLIVTSGYYI